MCAEVDPVLGLISSVITVLDTITKVYGDVKDAEAVPKEFREITQRLPIIQATLQIFKAHISTRSLGEESCGALKGLIQGCKDKALRLEIIFRKVVPQASPERLECYRVAIDTLGEGYQVEALIDGILRDIKWLAENPAVNAVTEAEVQKLAKAIEELSVMPASQSDENSINNYGSGTLNANIGKGNQNNNNASGKQFIGQNQYFSK
jgi:N-terminal domain on NACHT_NTPase and P-loop NTPases